MTETRRTFLKSTTLAGATLAAGCGTLGGAPSQSAAGMLRPMAAVRWAVIGVGARGSGHVETLLMLDGASVTAICDTHAPSLTRVVASAAKKSGHEPASYGADGNPNAWKHMLDRDDIDAVLIATPWELHTPMAVAAMQSGKHAFVEVPAALTIGECWDLVDTSEKTSRQCMMLENVNYGREELMLLNMVRRGLLGELLHGEASYIHDLRSQMFEVDHGTGSWRTPHYAHDQGNLYPTHGLGPVAHCMDVNRGDLFDHLVSMSTPARGRALFAKANFPADHKWNKFENWNCGDLSTSLIKLRSGRTIMVQWDETSPRPYTRHNYLQGTKGAFGGFPNRIALDVPVTELPATVRAKMKPDAKRSDSHSWSMDMKPWFEAFDHPMWKKVGELAAKHGGHGGMDFVMLWRAQQCLMKGKLLDQTVYDAAAWSAVTPLSRASVEQGSAPMKFPDFTRGKWRTTPPIAIEAE